MMLSRVWVAKGRGEPCEHQAHPIPWDCFHLSLLEADGFIAVIVLLWRRTRGGSGTHCMHALTCALCCPDLEAVFVLLQAAVWRSAVKEAELPLTHPTLAAVGLGS